jgi:hypothetical protein
MHGECLSLFWAELLRGCFFSGRERPVTEKFTLFFGCYVAVNLWRSGAFFFESFKNRTVGRRGQAPAPPISVAMRWLESPARAEPGAARLHRMHVPAVDALAACTAGGNDAPVALTSFF